MTKKTVYRRVLGPKALEMVMRDVLCGMEEIAIMKSFESNHLFEIISIESNDQEIDTIWKSYDNNSHLGKTISGNIVSLADFRTAKTLTGE